jgi:two-component system OmpR family sensor kinase
MNSIRRTLLARLIVGGTLATLIAAAGVYFMAYDEASGIFDSQLERMAYSLRDRLVERLDAASGGDEDTEHLVVIQVWDKAGTRLYVSHANIPMPERSQLGFSNLVTSQGEWRVFGLESTNQTVQVAQPLSVRRDLATRLALRTLTPILVLLPLVALLIWITVGRGLAPLLVLTRDLRGRRPGSLAPLPTSPLQEELQPMVGALNDLLARLERAMQGQRNFVADAAHELRTPLAALRLQAQNAVLAPTEHERAESLARLQAGIERAAHLVQQLLTLARQEPGEQARPFAPVDLAALARQAIADAAQLAAASQVDIGLLHVDPVSVQGDAEGLLTLLSNLLGNAIRYTPAQGKIDVSVRAAQQGALLEVLDTGPGISEAERSRVFDRFYRGAAAAASGSGLGLAIVKSIADAHGARVTLDARADGASGLRASVIFPEREPEP